MEPRILPLWRPEIEMVERMRVFLNENLIGQEEAVREICDLFIARSVRSEDDRRPFMTVFLNGPSGVGKTLLFELVWQFLNEDIKRKRSGLRVPVTKIPLNGVFAFEVVEMMFGISSWARNPGDSKKSKCETIYEEACDADPVFAMNIQIWDEWEKQGKSPNWDHRLSFDSISEVFEDAIMTSKQPDSAVLDWSNTIFCLTWNLFCNSVEDKRKPIGFAVPNEDATKEDMEEREEIDKEANIEKLRKHFSISSFNRVDRFIVFNDLGARWDMRRDFAEKEVRKMFDIIDQFYAKRGNPLPHVEQYGSFDTLVQESLDNCEKSGGFRAIKRYVQNTMLGRVLSLLHKDYPNVSKEVRAERRICRGSGRNRESVSREVDEFMETFGKEAAKAVDPTEYD